MLFIIYFTFFPLTIGYLSIYLSFIFLLLPLLALYYLSLLFNFFYYLLSLYPLFYFSTFVLIFKVVFLSLYFCLSFLF